MISHLPQPNPLSLIPTFKHLFLFLYRFIHIHILAFPIYEARFEYIVITVTQLRETSMKHLARIRTPGHYVANLRTYHLATQHL
jgi:hypothetical protein